MSSLKYKLLLCLVALVAVALPVCAQSTILADESTMTWTLDAGGWAIGATSVGTSGQAGIGEDPADDADGVAGGVVLGYALGANYGALVAAQYATSSSVDCTGVQNVTLNFARWLNVEQQEFAGPPVVPADVATIEYSIDGGTTWTLVWENPTGAGVFDTAWADESYTLDDAAGEADVMVRFGLGPTDADVRGMFGGWNIDNLEIAADSNEYSVDDQSFPSALGWDEEGDMSVTLLNTGQSTWNDTFALVELADGVTPTVAANRWGVGEIAVDGDVAPDDTFEFAATMVAPPLSSIRYLVPFSATTPAGTAADVADSGLGAAFELYSDGTVVARPNGEANPSALILVSRFPDESDWARFYIEELAGRAAKIVEGYPNGTYDPARIVTRGQIAVFVVRAAGVAAPDPVVAPFRDVPIGYWADNWIAAAQAEGFVSGYADGTYRPEDAVTREAMAKVVALGAGLPVDLGVVPADLTFTDAADVATGLAPYVQSCVDAVVVTGYPDGSFQPAREVSRDQLAVFVWRAFMREIPTAVVLGGPAFTAEDVAAAPVAGFPSVSAVTPSGPVDVYVVVDAVAAATSAGDSAADIVVEFELRDAATPTSGPVLWSGSVTITAATLNAAAAAALATDGTGEPYVAGAVNIPEAALVTILDTAASIDVALTTEVNGLALKRMPTLTIAP